MGDLLMPRQSRMPAFLAGFFCCWLIGAVLVGTIAARSGAPTGQMLYAAAAWPRILLHIAVAARYVKQGEG